MSLNEKPGPAGSGARSAAEAERTLTTRVLTLMAARSPLAAVLEAIVLHLEAEHPRSLCAIQLLDEEGERLLTGAAPSLPDFFNEAIHGERIGAARGSCGSAASLGERVVVEEIRTHPWWAEFKDLAARAGLESCWSEPIRGSSGQVLGTFAIYHRHPQSPSDAELDAIAQASRLAAIAIERHRSDEELRRSDERYRGIFENAPIGIYKAARDGRILAANPAFATLLGYDSADEVLPLRMAEDIYFDPGERERLIAKYGPGGSVSDLDLTWKRKDGSPVDIRLNSHVVRDEAGRAVGYDGFVTDVTRPKRDERLLRESEDRYRDLVEHSRDLICTHDLEGRLLSVNPWAAESLGYDRETLLRLNLRDLIPAEFQDRLPLYLETIRRDGAARGLLELRTAAGERRTWEYHNTLRTEGVERPVVRGMARDVTEVRRAERQRIELEERLRQAAKMEAVGSLAGGVAHDFNNMLAVILGNTEIALTEVGADHPLHDSLQQIRAAAERSVELTRQLLGFARKQTIRPRELDLNEAVESMLKMLRRLIGENLELEWLPGEGLWPVRMDPAQIDQILANLAVNARDAIDESGTLTIATRNVRGDEVQSSTQGELEARDHVLLEVRDTGAGMDEATLGRLFEPFFTTKATGRGTGMGLATVYGIVRQNGGAIRVESAPGRGSTFRTYLPRAGETARREAAAAEPSTARGSETILMVEDEAAVLDLGRRVLERSGFRVLAARTPAQALAIAHRYDAPIHLLLTDVMLPGMSGKELRDELGRSRPEIRCLYISGYTSDIIANRGVLEEDAHFLGKPFTIAALAAKVRQVLDV